MYPYGAHGISNYLPLIRGYLFVGQFYRDNYKFVPEHMSFSLATWHGTSACQRGTLTPPAVTVCLDQQRQQLPVSPTSIGITWDYSCVSAVFVQPLAFPHIVARESSQKYRAGDGGGSPIPADEVAFGGR